MRITTCKKIAAVAILAGLMAIPARAVSMLEGKITKGTRQTGEYDLLLQVWCKKAPSDAARLLQTIQIPKVSVVDGGFKILVDAGVDLKDGSKLDYTIQARPFETGKPFEAAEVSHVSIETPAPGIVLR